jgi:hypothetical protein
MASPYGQQFIKGIVAILFTFGLTVAPTAALIEKGIMVIMSGAVIDPEANPNLSILSAIKSLVELLINPIRLQAFKTGNFKKAFADATTVAILECFEFLNRTENIIATGDIRLFKSDKFIELAEALRQAEIIKTSLINQMHSKSPSTKFISDLLTKINTVLEQGQSLISKVPRIEPASIVIHSEPGAGKTTMARELMLICQMATGLKVDATDIFTPINGDFRWEGYRREKFIINDDTCPLLPNQHGATKAIEDMLTLVSTADFRPDMAALGEGGKGKVSVAPVAVLTLCNDFTQSVKFILSEPSAYFRRSMYVHVTVSPKYSKTGKAGGVLNFKDVVTLPDDVYSQIEIYELLPDK